MGTAKYKDENEWENFIAEHGMHTHLYTCTCTACIIPCVWCVCVCVCVCACDVYMMRVGGSSNAFTDAEHTVYHFDINPQHFDAALDRFSSFFIAPLFARSSTTREIKAVNSEFMNSVNDDEHRIDELRNATARAHHPLTHFSWGNSASLSPFNVIDGKSNNDDTNAKTKRRNKKTKTSSSSSTQSVDTRLRTELLSFYHRYYSSHAMKLILIGPHSLTQLQTLASKYFSHIQHNHQPLTDFTHASTAFDHTTLAHYTLVCL